jgi:hypothetical protein
MATIKYRCNNCELKHEFNGDKFTSNCDVCDSENIEVIKEDKIAFYIKYLQDNWKIVVPVLIVLFLFFLFINEDSGLPGNTTVFVVSQNMEQQDNYLLINMEKWDSNDGHWKIDKKVISPSEQIKLIKTYIISINVNNTSKDLTLDGNKIYLCSKDENAPINIKYKGQVLPSRFLKPIQTTFQLNGKQPSEKANCDVQCLVPNEISLTTGNCKFKVNIKRAFPGKKIMVSINGENGTYKQQLEWDVKGIKKFDVWVTIEGLSCGKVSSSDNGTSPSIHSCIECNAQKQNELSIELSRLLNNLGKAPNDRNNQVAFSAYFKHFLQGSNKFKLNGKIYSDWSDLEQVITIQNENDKKTFKLNDAVKISNDCTSVSFEFIYD